MVLKGRFSLTLLVIVLSLLIVLWLTTSELYVRIIPLLPAFFSWCAFMIISTNKVFPRIKYISKYLIVKSFNLLLNIAAILSIFLAGFSDKILMVFVYLVSYLILLLHFTYFIVKDRNTREE